MAMKLAMPQSTPQPSPQPRPLPRDTIPTVRRLFLGDDVSAAVRSLATAFASDPLLRYIYNAAPSEDITARNEALFRAVLSHQLSRREGRTVVHTDAHSGVVAVWQEAGAWRTGTRDMLRLMPALLRTFGLNCRAHSTRGLLEAQHPQERCHVHLQFLGRVKGPNSSDDEADAVIGRMLDRLDINRMPAYVESANPDDVKFYEHHGFVVCQEVILRPGAPRVVGMWREPNAN